jgi:hypothetical protein
LSRKRDPLDDNECDPARKQRIFNRRRTAIIMDNSSNVLLVVSPFSTKLPVPKQIIAMEGERILNMMELFLFLVTASPNA